MAVFFNQVSLLPPDNQAMNVLNLSGRAAAPHQNYCAMKLTGPVFGVSPFSTRRLHVAGLWLGLVSSDRVSDSSL